MSIEHPIERRTDFSDMPRKLVWAIIAIERLGISIVVIGTLLYIVFFNQNKVVESNKGITEVLTKVAVAMTTLDGNDKTIIDNQREIMRLIPR